MKTKTYYMHTLDGQPAAFTEGYICFAYKQVLEHEMATSLRQLRRQQADCISRRSSEGLGNDFDYGYVRIKLQ